METYSFRYVNGPALEYHYSIQGPRGEIATVPLYDDAKTITDALNAFDRSIIMYCPSCNKPSAQMPAFLCPSCRRQD